jgi:hypothetical protein
MVGLEDRGNILYPFGNGGLVVTDLDSGWVTVWLPEAGQYGLASGRIDLEYGVNQADLQKYLQNVPDEVVASVINNLVEAGL